MSAPLDPELADEIRRRARAARERMAGGNFTQMWALGGKNAIVQPGGSETVRLCPRWDYAQSMILVDGKRVPNPEYKKRRAFVVAFEHWWDGPDGKTVREWCPRSLDEQSYCPVCEAAAALMQSSSAEDKKLGKRIAAKEVYIFNAVVGDPRRLNDQRVADIRPLPLTGTLFTVISDIMTGGDEGKAKFARGDITDPRSGLDLDLRRPSGKVQSERWSVTAAVEATPLYSPEQTAAFKGWVTRLVDLEKMLQDEAKTPEALFKAYYGRDPKAGEMGRSVSAGRQKAQQAVQQQTAPVPAQEPDDFGDAPTDADIAEPDAAAAPATAAPPRAAQAAPDASAAEDDDEFMPPPAGARQARGLR